LEVKSKGVPRELFLEAIKEGKKSVTFNHVLGFHERLRRYHTINLLEADIHRKISTKDTKRVWKNDNSMPLVFPMVEK
jgi:uncharacterized protein (DUF2342 family)